ncbi:MAG: AMP-binding protein [Candidatus Rokubacteria bacterium]|nr:AMP-binding protein [Candidatus Rokubacteria bacterium]
MSANFAALVAAHATSRPSGLAVTGRESLTWAALDRRAAGTARVLADRGVKPGDRVALVLGNDERLAVALLAVWRLGATAAPLSLLLGSDDRREILADLAPRLALDDVPAVDGDAPIAPAAAPALVLYTSGSTGRPKGAVLSHAAVTAANRSWAEPVMALTPDDVVLAALPLAHSFGLNGALLAPLLAGTPTVVLERFTPEAAIDALVRHRVTVVPAVATMFRRMLDSAALSRAAFGSVRIALSGAAPCPWELADEWRARTGVRILRGYGMTELFRPISYLAGDPTDRPDAIGRPVPGVEVRFADDTGRALPQGEVGELLIRTPCAMDGYLDAPDATREVLEDGWFRTGDLAVQSPEGYVSIVGRKRERILRAGYSVFPAEVERVLATHAAVAEAAVVGVPHGELGEEVAAFVALRPGAAASAEELIAYCRERLAAYKYPRSIAILDRLPRSASGKVLKAQLTSAR